jgi:hypothetical protein
MVKTLLLEGVSSCAWWWIFPHMGGKEGVCGSEFSVSIGKLLDPLHYLYNGLRLHALIKLTRKGELYQDMLDPIWAGYKSYPIESLLGSWLVLLNYGAPLSWLIIQATRPRHPYQVVSL